VAKKRQLSKGGLPSYSKASKINFCRERLSSTSIMFVSQNQGIQFIPSGFIRYTNLVLKVPRLSVKAPLLQIFLELTKIYMYILADGSNTSKKEGVKRTGNKLVQEPQNLLS
jgi:hypothetical protein